MARRVAVQPMAPAMTPRLRMSTEVVRAQSKRVGHNDQLTSTLLRWPASLHQESTEARVVKRDLPFVLPFVYKDVDLGPIYG